KPRLVQTHALLGSALSMKGMKEEAVEEYKVALRINPDEVLALNDLAWILATDSDDRLRNGSEAVTLAERACQLSDFKEPLIVGTLAAAYAEAGRFEEAVRTGEKAKGMAEKAGNKELAAKNEELLKLYREGKP